MHLFTFFTFHKVMDYMHGYFQVFDTQTVQFNSDMTLHIDDHQREKHVNKKNC